MAEKTQRIGIFDSGLGGTTVLKEMIKSLPNEDYIYYGDNGNFPYGSGKTKNELQKLTERILDFFVKNNCKLVIVACNTASTAAIDYLREKFSLPIIVGNFLQQIYNLADTLIVGKYIGANALASVGSVYYSYGMGTLEELTNHIFL